MVGDSDFEDIRGEVLERGHAVSDGLRVDVPVGLPGVRGDLMEEVGFFHGITEFGFEDDGESFHGEIKVDS